MNIIIENQKFQESRQNYAIIFLIQILLLFNTILSWGNNGCVINQHKL